MIETIYKQIFPRVDDYLKKELYGMNTILELGCGSNSPMKAFSGKAYMVGVDINKKTVTESRKKKIHDKYIISDVLKIKFPKKSFDCAVALDLIEHLPKNKGLMLMKKMENIARKRVVIYTPNGFVPQHGEKWQRHVSGWTAGEFRNLGYNVIGVNGLKYLRGEYAEIKFRPRYAWMLISDLTQKIVKKIPNHAYHLLCIKEVSQS